MANDGVQSDDPANSADRPPIDLAHERPFRLGPLAVAPALREVAAPDGTRQVLEPRVMQVLVALTRAGGAIVGRDELIRTCWNGTVVGEGAINRAVSLLRKLSEGLGGGAFRIETVARVGYRLVLPGPDPHRDAPPAAVRPRRLAWAALALVVVAGAAAALLWPPAATGPAYSVRVEPFRISGNATSFNEELLSTLTRQDVPLAAGRSRLLLAGSVEERDGALRVNARLTDPDGGEVLWSGALDRAAAEPGGAAAAAAIVGSIAQCTLAGANDGARDGDGTVPAELLSRYARTCELGYRGQPRQGLRAARELTRQAPDFAPGWFALSYHARTVYRTQPRADPALRDEALAAADRLVALRPGAQDGYASRFAALDPAPTAEHERLLLRATRLEPRYVEVAPAYFADFLAQVGRLDEAFALRLQEARQRPDEPGAHIALFETAAATARWAVADQSLERMRQLDPRPLATMQWRKAVGTEDWAQAVRTVAAPDPASQRAAIATYRARASGTAADRRAALALVEGLPAGCCVRLRVELLALLGRPAEAIALLDRRDAPAAERARAGLPFLWDPALRPLWHDPAFAPFLRRHGWIAYWNEARVKPDPCRAAEAPPFCRLLRG